MDCILNDFFGCEIGPTPHSITKTKSRDTGNNMKIFNHKSFGLFSSTNLIKSFM